MEVAGYDHSDRNLCADRKPERPPRLRAEVQDHGNDGDDNEQRSSEVEKKRCLEQPAGMVRGRDQCDRHESPHQRIQALELFGIRGDALLNEDAPAERKGLSPLGRYFFLGLCRAIHVHLEPESSRR